MINNPTAVGAVSNRTLCVNLRKELVCSRAIHAPLIFKEKRRNELRDYER